MSPLDLVGLLPLMGRTQGRSDILLGLIDGPVATHIPEFAGTNIRQVSRSKINAGCHLESTACLHGTFIAGILSAKRGSFSPAICPGCTLLIRSIFADAADSKEDVPSANPKELAAAIFECVEAGARCINLSLTLMGAGAVVDHELHQALNHALKRGVVVVAAAGNQGTLTSTAITRHQWVIPVVACDRSGRPTRGSNLGSSSGKGGLAAPGEAIASLGADGKRQTLGGTSVATAFVSGAVALLLSEFPTAKGAQVKFALTRGVSPRPRSVVPPLLNAEIAHQFLAADGMER